MTTALLFDVRQAVRALQRDRGFTFVALSTLSTGLGMCIVVAVLANAYLWRGLPYPHSDRLYDFQFVTPAIEFPTGMEKLDWRSLDDVIELGIAWDLDTFSLRGGSFPEVVQGTWVTRDYMDGFGVRPAIGRGFDAEDFEPGRPSVALISHRLWQTRFSGDPAIVGRTFEAYVNDRPNEVEQFRVVGVLGRDHWHMNVFTEVMSPLRAPSHPYVVRLREGVPPAVAADRITALVRDGAATVPKDWRADLRSTHGTYVERIRPLLVAVASATGLVLMIACANISVLLTVRATRRQRENAVRQALGASSGQLTRATITEPLILVGSAVALGLALAWATLSAVAPVLDRYMGRAAPGGTSALRIDPETVLATIVVGLIVGAFCAFIPGWIARRAPADIAGGQKGATDGPASQRARAALIAVEVAACLTLLTGAGLTIQSAMRILQVDMGLETDAVVVGRFSLRPRAYPDAATRSTFYERVLSRAGEMRTVDSIAFTNAWPLQQSQLRDVGTGGAASFQTRAGIVGVSPDYFAALGISIQAGRAFNGGDRMGSAPVAIVSRTLASRIWRNDNPIGQTLVMSPAGGAPATARPATFTVIGVASDIRHTHTDDDLADAYVPLLQSPSPAVFAYLRVSGNETTAEREFQQLLASVDPDVGFAMVRPLADILDEQRAGARLLATLLVVFAAFAAALALVGMYGVIAYTVKQREREIAVRMAIGADRQTIARLFLRQGAMVLALGLAVGVGGSLALGRVLQTQLFNVPATDPSMIAGAAAAFALCGFAAIAWPARAAASLDPAHVLKES